MAAFSFLKTRITYLQGSANTEGERGSSGAKSGASLNNLLNLYAIYHAARTAARIFADFPGHWEKTAPRGGRQKKGIMQAAA
jgi:hypothetical protein